MSDIIDILKNAPEYIGGNGRTDTEIETAEKQLGIKFSPDYRCYLKDIGLACFDGHELTGMGNIRDVIPFPRTVNNCDL